MPFILHKILATWFNVHCGINNSKLFLLFQRRYYKRDDARKAMCYINRTKLDDRIIRTDWDAGFVEGRQFGRGRTGGQVSASYNM